MKSFVDDESIKRLVGTYSDMVFRIAYQGVRVREDAKDIVQEVFISLLKRFPFESEEHMRAWLIRVTVNKAKNCLKSAQRKKTLPLAEEHYLIADKQQKDYLVLLREIDKLPPEDRQIIYLFYFEECTANFILRSVPPKK